MAGTINQASLEKVAHFNNVCKENGIEIVQITLKQIINDSVKPDGVIDFSIFFESLVASGIMSEEKLTKILAQIDGVEYFDYFSQKDLQNDNALKYFDPKAYSIFKNFFFVPLRVEKRDNNNPIIHFGMKNPSNKIALQKLKEVMTLFLDSKYQNIKFDIVTYTMSISALQDYFFYFLKTITDDDLYKAMTHITVNVATSDDTERTKSVSEFMQKLFAKAVYEGVSDIHFEPNKKRGRIKFRKNGVLVPVLTMDIAKYTNVLSALSLWCSNINSINRTPMDGRIEEKEGSILELLKINYEIDNVDYRVSYIPNALNNEISLANYSVVIRILSRRGGIPSLEKLGFQDAIQKKISYISDMAHGIFLITGPTGSGKSTTLYSILSRINATERNIITIEDPVEYRNDMWKQVQINEKQNLTFASAITHFLRHDPDIMLVGEIRDVETAKQAIIASNTGHLVLSTLHTNDAPSAITRLIDLGINEFNITDNIIGILAQRLTRIVCPKCSVHKPILKKDSEWIEEKLKSNLPKSVDIKQYIPEEVAYSNPNGCEFCHHTGYTSRVVISEICLFNEEIKERIIDKNYRKILELMLELNPYNTLLLSGLKRVMDFETTIEEIKRVI